MTQVVQISGDSDDVPPVNRTQRVTEWFNDKKNSVGFLERFVSQSPSPPSSNARKRSELWKNDVLFL